jgi:phosphate transport system substrate-binding protein
MKRITKRLALLTVAAVLASLLTSCAGRGEVGGESGRVTIIGSTSVAPYIEVLAENYTDGVVDVMGGGSGRGIQVAKEGTADIGMSSRALKDDEKEELPGRYFDIAKDGIALIVHPNNPVKDLTLEQIRDIYTGKITDWSELCGDTDWRDLGYRHTDIHVVTREEGSGTRGAFEELVMSWEVKLDVWECVDEDCDAEGCNNPNHEMKQRSEKFSEMIDLRTIVLNTNGGIRQFVTGNPNAIGFVSLGLAQPQDPNARNALPPVQGVSIAGVAPTEANLFNGAYQLYRPFVFIAGTELSNLSKEARDFLSYLLSDEGQNELTNRGLVPVRDERIVSVLEG